MTQRLLAALIAILLVPAAAGAAATPESHLDPAAKKVLVAYVSALHDKRYGDAFKLLSQSQRAYFLTAGNFASIFIADGLRIDSFRVIGSRKGGSLGYVGLVSENVHFTDHAHQTTGSATVTVPYGIVHGPGSTWVIKDPLHPWKAFVPTGASTTVSGLKVIVRKVSLFSWRIEALMTFVNVGDGFVTLLPYGRSVLRDAKGNVFHPIATKLASLTDSRLYKGLRLAAGAQYTGSLSFSIPTGSRPTRLDLTVAPNLRDGADSPFEVALPSIDVPALP